MNSRQDGFLIFDKILVDTISQDQVSREDQLRFKLNFDGDQLDDLISYNQLMQCLEDNTYTVQLENRPYKLNSIKDDRGPYTSSDPEYFGSSYNLFSEWDARDINWEPLSNIIPSDPCSCGVYANKHDLFNTQGWKLLKGHTKTVRILIRTLRKQKYRQTKTSRK